MFVSQNVPDWVDRRLKHVLPGGKGWEVDRDAGHPVLAVRLSKWAVGPFGHRAYCDEGEGCRVLRLREPTPSRTGGFTGRLEIHRLASGAMAFLLHDFGGVRRYPLPIVHPGRFETLLIELTQPLDDLPPSQFDGPSKWPALLRSVLRDGHRWENDRRAGHQVLAARIHRLSMGWLDPGSVRRVGGTVFLRNWLPMADGRDGFWLEVLRPEDSDRFSVGDDAARWEFTLRPFPSGMWGFDPGAHRPMSTEDKLVLTISDPVAFWRLLHELSLPAWPRW